MFTDMELRSMNPLNGLSPAQSVAGSLRGFSMSDEEVWRPVVGYEGAYEVSNMGRIRSLDRKIIAKNGIIRNRKGALSKFGKAHNRYATCGLCKEGRNLTRVVHRVVMEAFVGKSELQINHKDGNGFNNNLDNLEYVTCRENNNHWRLEKFGKIKGYTKTQAGNYCVYVTENKKRKSIGTFKTEEEAISAYKNKVYELGEYKYAEQSQD